MQHPAPGRQPVTEYVKHIITGLPVMNDYRQIQLGRKVKLGDKEFYLGLFVAEFTVIIKADLAYGYDPGQLNALFNGLNPIPAGGLYFGRGHPYRMVHVGRRLQIIVYSGKIVKTVTNGDNTVYLNLTGFLNNNKLLNRVIANEPYMGMSIKILHNGFHKKRFSIFQTGLL
jgi:hypothetical protein